MVGEKDVRWITGGLFSGQAALDIKTEAHADTLLPGSKVIVTDEAQRIPDIGLKVKILVDRNLQKGWGTKIFLSGPSSLQLASGLQQLAIEVQISSKLFQNTF